MSKRPTLKVEKRTVLGENVKKLRKTGIFPANIYGKDIKSLAVQVPYKDFEAVYKDTGETGLVDLQVDGQIRPVLIHNVQKDHLTKTPLHADFYQVNLKEKVKTMVAVATIGEPKAVTDKLGLLMQTLHEIEVEALPADLPEKIEINIEHLANVNDQITIADIKTPTGVTILTDPGQVIVKIVELVTKEAEAEAKAEAAAAEAAKAELAPAEEGAPAEGAAPAKSSGEPKGEKPAEAPKEESK
ncbi:MAG: 50S ribosomal protein L25 [Candidatus Levyibacteriota bacterium]|nr:MAG: 50S ribosomal protein L25 [Candidatus Levybacteria bacterium]